MEQIDYSEFDFFKQTLNVKSTNLQEITWTCYLPFAILPRLNVRIEHLKHSNCQVDFKKRIKENEQRRIEAKKAGVKIPKGELKRKPALPRSAHRVNITKNKPEFLTPLPYEFIA